MTRTEVQNFREDFQNAVAKLQKKYGVNINAGTIRYSEDELRFKVTARKGEVIEKLDKDSFSVGDKVTINHKKCTGKTYEITKIMTKNIMVMEVNGSQQVRVSPFLLKKV